MKKDTKRKQRRTVRINGVRIVNAENIKEPEKEGKDATEGTSNLVWLTDNDNLEL